MFSISQFRFWSKKRSAERRKYVVRGPTGLMWCSSVCRRAEAERNLRAVSTQLPWSASSKSSPGIFGPKGDGLDSQVPLLWKRKPKGSRMAWVWGPAFFFFFFNFLLMPDAIKALVKEVWVLCEASTFRLGQAVCEMPSPPCTEASGRLQGHDFGLFQFCSTPLPRESRWGNHCYLSCWAVP